MQISEVTGLPELPEGYYWKITEKTTIPHNSFGKIYIMRIRKDIVKKGFPFFWKEVEVEKHVQVFDRELYRFNVRTCGEDMLRIIRKFADAAYRDWQEQTSQQAVKNTVAYYAGNYPPKSLNGL